MSEWKEIQLGDVFQVKHGWAFKGEFFRPEGELIVVTPGNFYEQGGFRVREGKEKFYLGTFPQEYLLSKGKIVIAMTEQGPGLLGSPGIIPEDNRFLHNQRIGLITDIDKTKIDENFIYYLFFTSAVRNEIFGSSTGTKVKHTAPKRIYSISVKVPDVITQQKIASILSAYDDLIENNLKRIKLLEEIAQRTYEEWFVKFRVNDEQLVIDDGAGLPVGWEMKKLVDVAVLTMGQSPKSEFYNSEKIGLPFHQGVSDYGDRFPSNSTWSTEGTRFAEKGDILFSVRAPVGRLNIAIEKIILGRGLASIRHKRSLNSPLFYQLQKIFFKDDIMGGGAIFNSVTKKDVENIEVVEANDKTMDNFNNMVNTIDSQIEKLTIQNRLLKEARDILLPRLMSGEIDVEVMKENVSAIIKQ